MQPLHKDVDHRILVLLRRESTARKAGQRGEHDVVAHRKTRHNALGFAVFWQHHDSGADGGWYRSAPYGLAIDLHGTTVELHDSGERLERLGAPGAEQSAEPDDLTRADLDVDAVDLMFATEIVGHEHGRGARGVRTAERGRSSP